VKQFGLFEEPVQPFRANLAERLKYLAARGIFIGTSSWKYEGWLGQIYSRDRYVTRGKFSQSRFEQTCIEEYAETFPVVCGDFTFYQFPSEQFWKRFFLGAPPGLRFAFKVPEEITSKTKDKAFLDAEMLKALFLEPLGQYRERVVALILEFGAFNETEGFTEALDDFLRRLPTEFRYAVEIRNKDLLTPEYLEALKVNRAAHVYNAWTRMPELGEQLGIQTTDFTLTRALLRKGRPYEQAVKKFQPYEQVQEVNEAGRAALREIIGKADKKNQPAYIFVNNRFEGNAPGTIAAIVED
jgi:uncharacterized protein YecE (DUF72 family)